MGYYIDLERFSITECRKKLKSADLVPSRKVLQENIDEYFAAIAKYEIANVAELLTALKSKDKIKAFSKKSGVDENYLTVLVREIKSCQPKPNKLKDFLGVDEKTICRLEELGIRTTVHLYDRVLTIKDRKLLAESVDADEAEITRLAKLADLSRIRWVNHTFAYMLFEAGFDTVKKVAAADYEILYQKIKVLNEEKKIYKAHIGLHDMKLCVEAAKEVPLDIAY